jgi:uncharacterized protein YcsI (UPF0317 family)
MWAYVFANGANEQERTQAKIHDVLPQSVKAFNISFAAEKPAVEEGMDWIHVPDGSCVHLYTNLVRKVHTVSTVEETVPEPSRICSVM